MRTRTLFVGALAALLAACNGSLYHPSSAPHLSRVSFLAFGDSITFGVSAPCGTGTASLSMSALMAALAAEPAQPWSYPTVLEAKLRDRYVAQHPTVTNRGIGGETLFDGLNRINTVITEEHPQVMLLLEGANDINNQFTTNAGIASGLAAIIRAARTRGVQSYVATLLPQRAGACRAGGPTRIAPANDLIRAMAASEGAVLVDVYQAFGGEAGSLIGVDGLHPNEAGYAKIADTFYDEIRRRLED